MAQRIKFTLVFLLLVSTIPLRANAGMTCSYVTSLYQHDPKSPEAEYWLKLTTEMVRMFGDRHTPGEYTLST
jgi:hypothetical protein